MIEQTDLAGSFTLPGASMTVNRMGYGAMQLAGRNGKKLVWGPPRNIDAALALLREVVASGVNHIDTSDFYGPHITNQIIRKALHPYPDDLVIVTKVSVRRGEDGSWIPAFSPEELTAAIHDNLRNLGLDVLDVVNLRSMFSIHEPAEWKEWHVGDAVTSKIGYECLIGSMREVVVVLYADNRSDPSGFRDLPGRDVAKTDMTHQTILLEFG